MVSDFSPDIVSGSESLLNVIKNGVVNSFLALIKLALVTSATLNLLLSPFSNSLMSSMPETGMFL